jgi:two-component system cell cycle sensor histidine kinase/response regulator CckA
MPNADERNRETILVTEDEKMVRELVGAVLKAEGYDVLAAADGREAVQIFQDRAGAVDLLLTDMVMPGMSGPELAASLLERHPTLKVLYMSGYTEYAVLNQGVLERIQSFIWKPFSNTALVKRVREVLDGQPPSQPGAAGPLSP